MKTRFVRLDMVGFWLLVSSGGRQKQIIVLSITAVGGLPGK